MREEHVVALHDFHSTNETCLSFSAGQIIKVFNRDESGWWDGEIDGERGWFPSNYVDEEGMAVGGANASQPIVLPSSEVDLSRSSMHSPAQISQALPVEQPLSSRRSTLEPSFVNPYRHNANADNSNGEILEPIEHSILLLQNAVRASRWAHFQPATACVISSVRSVLSATDCLTRESTTLKSHPVLAKERKQVLSELSRLVTQSRRASAVAKNEQPNPQEMHDMLRHAANVLINTKRFLAAALECGAAMPDSRTSLSDPPHDVRSSERSEIDKTPTPGSVRSSYLTAQTSAADVVRGTERSSSSSSYYDNGRMQSLSGPAQNSNERVRKHNLHFGVSRARADSAAMSVATDESGTSNSDLSQRKSSRAACSSDDQQEPEFAKYNCQQVLDRLKGAHEHLLSVVAAIIGHAHTHSRESHASSYAFLIDITRETVDNVRNLLFIVEAICENVELCSRHAREVSILLERRESLYEATTALVTAARVVSSKSTMESALSKLSSIPDTEDQEKKNLLAAATTLLRTGQECVGAVRMCLRKADDSTQIIMTTQTKAQVAKEARAEAQRLQEEADKEEEEESTMQTAFAADIANPFDTLSLTRGRHTLSFLSRKATSLSCLQQKYEHDVQGPASHADGAEPSNSEGQRSVLDEGTAAPLRPAFSHSSISDPDGSVSSVRGMLANTDLSGETSDASDVLSRHRSQPSGSTLHSLHSSRTDLTTDTNPSAAALSSPTERKSSNTTTVGSGTVDDREASTLAHGDDRFHHFRQQSKPLPQLRTSLSQGEHHSGPYTAPGAGCFPHNHPLAMTGVDASKDAVQSCLDARFMAPGYDPTDICYNSDGEVTGATLPALVEKMTPHDTTVEASFSNAFFLCFRLFTDPIELFEALVRRYNLATPAEVEANPEVLARWKSSKVMPVRLRVLNFFKTWLELHWQPASDRPILAPLDAFISASVTHSLQRSGQHLAELVQRRMSESGSSVRKTALQAGGNRGAGSLKRVMSADKVKSGGGQSAIHIDTNSMYLPLAFPAIKGGSPPVPLVSKSLLSALRAAILSPDGSVGPHVLEFDPLELARQVTIMESKVFCSILPEELLGQEFSKSNGQSSSVHVKQMASFNTKITGWVTECVLGEEDAKKRTQVVKHFIKVGDKMLALKNYNALFAIQSGLNASTILRLRKTWDGLPTKYHNLMEEQRRVMEHTRNFSAYRTRIRSAMPPAMPFVGLILTDLTFCADGNSNTRPSPLSRNKQLINFDKYCKLSRIISELQRFQIPYNFVEVPEIQTYFADVVLADRSKKSLGPEDLYRRSLWLEPRSQGQSRASQVQPQAGGAGSVTPELGFNGSSSVNNSSQTSDSASTMKSINSRSERSGSVAATGLDLFNWK